MAKEKEIEKGDIGQVSRREFLKDAGLLVGGATVGSMAFVTACGGTATATQPAVTTTVTVSKFICPNSGCGQEFSSLAALQAHIKADHPNEAVPEKLTKLTVNGVSYEVKVEPNWTLLDVLRNQLGLTGTKISCDEGSCGVCTVLIDGKSMYSCMVLGVECNDKKIETIESLYNGVTLSPIQQAFVENFGYECGYCTPGMIMSTKALLDNNPDPTEQEIRQALAGNICKCGAYQYIVGSVSSAAKKMKGG